MSPSENDGESKDGLGESSDGDGESSDGLGESRDGDSDSSDGDSEMYEGEGEARGMVPTNRTASPRFVRVAPASKLRMPSTSSTGMLSPNS